MKETCTTCNWRTTCDLRRSGNALRCTVWKADHFAPVDILLIILSAALFFFVLYALPLIIMAAKGVAP